jgi:hypothetical protein
MRGSMAAIAAATAYFMSASLQMTGLMLTPSAL